MKFKIGDKVHINKELGSSMSHFKNDIDVIIIGTSGEDEYVKYSVLFLDGTQCAWYYEKQLIFIEHVGMKEIKRIEWERNERENKESQFEYIIENWKTFINNDKYPFASIEALGKLMGINNIWGSRGEGIDLIQNQQTILNYFNNKYVKGTLKETIEILRNTNQTLEINLGFCAEMKEVNKTGK